MLEQCRVLVDIPLPSQFYIYSLIKAPSLINFHYETHSILQTFSPNFQGILLEFISTAPWNLIYTYSSFEPVTFFFYGKLVHTRAYRYSLNPLVKIQKILI